MIKISPSSFAARPACLSVCTLITSVGIIFAQSNENNGSNGDKKAIARPVVMTPVKASPVIAGKANPITGIRATPIIKATPIEIGPSSESKDGERPVLEDQLSYANLLYSHKQYAIAIRQYELFLKDHPQSPNAASAAYRLGECYLQLPQLVQAKQAYEHLITQYKTGVYAGAAAFRLATLYFNEKNYAKAVPYFEIAEKNISNPKLELQAFYYRAHCLQLTGEKAAAVAAFEKLMASQTQAKGIKNPFAETSLLAIARLYTELGDNEKALIAFKNIIAQSKDPEHLDEAYARAGLIAAKLGKREESNQLLDPWWFDKYWLALPVRTVRAGHRGVF